MAKTTIKIDLDLSLDLLIVSRLNNLTKEELVNRLLKEGIKPYMENIKKQRFS